MIGKRWILSDSEKHTPQGVGHHRGRLWWPWNVVQLVFASWVIPYANEGEDHSNHWETIHSSILRQCLGKVLAPLGVSFSSQIGDQGLAEFDLSSWTHSILIGLCYSPGLVIISKFVPCPLPSYFKLFSWAPSGPTVSPLQSSGGTTRK